MFSVYFFKSCSYIQPEISFSFPCGRWLGRGVDDDSSERLLIGKRLPEGHERGRSLAATRIRSPSVPPAKPTVSDSELQQHLGIKYRFS